MAEFSLSDLPVLYASAMDEITTRIEATNELIQAAVPTVGSERPDFIKMESACLQIRKICELTAVAVLIAHNELPRVRTKAFMKQWNADALFADLLKINPEAFPRAVRDGFQSTGKFVIETTGFMTREQFKSAYSKLGEILHTGTLAALLKQPRNYVVDEINAWLHSIYKLLRHHIVVLPETGTFMTAQLLNRPDGSSSCAIWKYEKAPDGSDGMRCIHTARGPSRPHRMNYPQQT